MIDKIVTILGDEILGSRGYPTMRVEVWLDSGIAAHACVPSGTSTGEGEAHELREFAPVLAGNEDACALIVEAIQRAGFMPGEQVALALDSAARRRSQAAPPMIFPDRASACERRRTPGAVQRLDEKISDRLDRRWFRRA